MAGTVVVSVALLGIQIDAANAADCVSTQNGYTFEYGGQKIQNSNSTGIERNIGLTSPHVVNWQNDHLVSYLEVGNGNYCNSTYAQCWIQIGHALGNVGGQKTSVQETFYEYNASDGYGYLPVELSSPLPSSNDFYNIFPTGLTIGANHDPTFDGYWGHSVPYIQNIPINGEPYTVEALTEGEVLTSELTSRAAWPTVAKTGTTPQWVPFGLNNAGAYDTNWSLYKTTTTGIPPDNWMEWATKPTAFCTGGVGNNQGEYEYTNVHQWSAFKAFGGPTYP